MHHQQAAIHKDGRKKWEAINTEAEIAKMTKQWLSRCLLKLKKMSN